MTPTSLSPTAAADRASRTPWDVVVIGAGPAGSVAATLLARDGLDVLLVERCAMPRPKVCGSCLGSTGAAALSRLGLDAAIDRTPEVRTVEIHTPGASATGTVDAMRLVAREQFDTQLAGLAIDAGVTPLFGHRAVCTGDAILCDGPGSAATIRLSARAVVIASGLDGRSGPSTPDAQIRRNSPIGIGSIAPSQPTDPAPGRLQMLAGPAGYLGRVRLGNGQTDWAAAVRPLAIRRAGSPEAAISGIMEACGLRSDTVPSGWTGTPRLHRRRIVEQVASS